MTDILICAWYTPSRQSKSFRKTLRNTSDIITLTRRVKIAAQFHISTHNFTATQHSSIINFMMNSFHSPYKQ